MLRSQFRVSTVLEKLRGDEESTRWIKRSSSTTDAAQFCNGLMHRFTSVHDDGVLKHWYMEHKSGKVSLLNMRFSISFGREFIVSKMEAFV